jgi:membrane protein
MNIRPYMFVYENTATGRIQRIWKGLKRTAAYLMETEVHVYGFSIAANVLLSFFPFMVVMCSLTRHLFGRPAEEAIYFALRDYLPGIMGTNIPQYIKTLVNSRGALQWSSIALLFFTANGIFEPLEVALNKAFGITANRSYVRNQLVSMGLIFACGGLVLLSAVFAAYNQQWTRDLFGPSAGGVTWVVIKTAAIPATILALFLTYWILPNGPVPVARVLPAAVGVGLCLELFKYLVLWSWPWLGQKLWHEYLYFYASVSIILWSFFGAMIVLAGAEWAGRRTEADETPVLETV